MRKGDKIFAVVFVVFVALYVLEGIGEDYGIGYVNVNPSDYLIGLLVLVGIPWLIYRVITSYRKEKIALQ